MGKSPRTPRCRQARAGSPRTEKDGLKQRDFVGLANPDQCAERNQARILSSRDQRKKSKTFITDDNEGARDSRRLLLECQGLEAREFASCEEFLGAVRPQDALFSMFICRE